MQDILWIAVTIAFFAIAIAYVHFCERVKKGRNHEPRIDHHACRQYFADGVPALRIVASGEVLT